MATYIIYIVLGFEGVVMVNYHNHYTYVLTALSLHYSSIHSMNSKCGFPDPSRSRLKSVSDTILKL